MVEVSFGAHLKEHSTTLNLSQGHEGNSLPRNWQWMLYGGKDIDVFKSIYRGCNSVIIVACFILVKAMIYVKQMVAAYA